MHEGRRARREGPRGIVLMGNFIFIVSRCLGATDEELDDA